MQSATACRQGQFDKWYLEFFIVLNIKGGQRCITILYISVHITAEIATVDISAGNSIPDTVGRVKIGPDQISLYVFWHFIEGFGSGIRHRSADTQEILKGFTGIHKNAYLCFHGLSHVFKTNLPGHG